MTIYHSINENGIIGKICNGHKCNEHWCPLKEFHSDKSRKDGLARKCKLCIKSYQKSDGKIPKKNADRKYGRSNKGKKLRVNRNKKNREIGTRIIKQLKNNGCAICGYNKCYKALDFHHTNPDDKEFALDVRNMALKDSRIINEINKCIILCSNCHREIHDKGEHNNVRY